MEDRLEDRIRKIIEVKRENGIEMVRKTFMEARMEQDGREDELEDGGVKWKR